MWIYQYLVELGKIIYNNWNGQGNYKYTTNTTHRTNQFAQWSGGH